MTNQEILRIAQAQQAVDFNCAPKDFTRDANVVVISQTNEGAKKLPRLPYFCELVYFGTNVVASVDERIYDAVSDYLKDPAFPHYNLMTPNLHKLNAVIREYGYFEDWQAEFWLPDVNALAALPCPYETRLLLPDELQPLAETQRWNNALSGVDDPRGDVLGVGAYDHGQLVGLAGCSDDCERMWQIGIDVLPEYRRQGVASALTSRLAVEILARGKVPFYCCAWANLGSARNAIRSGFRPAWAQLNAKEIEP